MPEPDTRDDRIRDLWDRMTAEQHDRAWDRLDDAQRVDAVRAMFHATEEPVE